MPDTQVAEESTTATPTTTTSTIEDECPRRLSKDVEIADIGCGFGGLLVALAPLLPNQLLLGQ